jgi:hypothetical protein
VVGLFAGWQLMLCAGATLRRHHRWAVTVCSYPEAGQTHLCDWRERNSSGGDSRIRGTWDGVGIALRGNARADGLGTARTQLALPPGRYRVRARVAPPATGSGEIAVSGAANDRVFGRLLVPKGGEAGAGGAPGSVWLEGTFIHGGGNVNLDINVDPVGTVDTGAVGSGMDGGIVWISELLVERFVSLDIIPR